MVHHLTSPIMFTPFWTGSFLVVEKERGAHSLAPLFSRIGSSEFFLLGVCKRHYHEEMQNVKAFLNRIAEDAECITNEILASYWQEIEHCLSLCSAHIEIYRACKKLHEVHCFDNVSISPVHFMVEDNVLFYCHLRPDILHNKIKSEKYSYKYNYVIT
jgi:hypothetical protein